MSKQPYVELENNFLQVSFPYSQQTINTLRTLGRAKWDPARKHWLLPHSQPALDSLKRIFPTLAFGPNLSALQDNETESQLEAEERKYLPKQEELEITDFKFKTAPLWHQKVTFNFARSLDCSALFLEPGLGKTKIAIDLATWRFRKGQVRRVFYMTLTSVVPNWADEDVLQHLHDDFNTVHILKPSTTQKIKQLEQIYEEDKPGWIITNFDSIRNLEDFLLKIQSGKRPLFDHIFADESSKLKHATSERSKSAWRIGRTVKFKNPMTGTPITQSGEDVFSQYRFMNDKIFGPYATQFRAQFLIMGGFENRQIVGYRNFPEFLKKVYSAAIRFTKDRCLDLPPKVYQRRTAALDPMVSAKYKQLEKECVAEFGGSKIATPLVMTKIMKLSQITGGFIYEQGEDGKRTATHVFPKNPKLDVLEEILDEVAPSKVIIWCRFTQEIEVITALLKTKKIGFSAIHGAIKPMGKAEAGKECACNECRGCAVRRFQHDPTCRVFVGQSSTAGFGITLTAASVVVYYSNTYSLEDRIQSEDRCHRIGQKSSVTYIDIVAELASGKRTIDHDVLDVIRGKSAFANEVSVALMSKMVQRQSAVVPNPAFVRKHSKNNDAIIEEDAF